MKTVVVIQARLASTRLPGKVLADLHGKPLLAHVIERARAIKSVDLVALTTPREDAAQLWPLMAGTPWAWEPHRLDLAQRGSHTPPDVLSGFWRVAMVTEADVIVRLTGDTPLLATDVATWALVEFNLFPRPCHFAPDYLGTTRPDLAYPDGMDVEVFTREALEMAHREATGDDREHVTSWLWKQPERFRIGRLMPMADAWARGLKLSVDTDEDLSRVRRIMARVPAGDFSLAATLKAAKEVGL